MILTSVSAATEGEKPHPLRPLLCGDALIAQVRARNIPYVEGDPVSADVISLLGLSEARDVRWLGKGAEAQVYRVFPRWGDTFLFRDNSKNLRMYPSSRYYRSIKAAKSFCQKVSCDFFVPEVSWINETAHWIRVDDFQGVRVDHLIDRFGHKTHLGRSFLELYNTRVEAFADAVKALGETSWDITVSKSIEFIDDPDKFYDGRIAFFENRDDDELSFTVSIRSVLVNPTTLQMALMDTE